MLEVLQVIWTVFEIRITQRKTNCFQAFSLRLVLENHIKAVQKKGCFFAQSKIILAGPKTTIFESAHSKKSDQGVN